QDAVAFASDSANGVTEIRVAQGVYKPDQSEANPDGTNDRTTSFYLPPIPILGGFAGLGNPDPDLRDIDTYPTVLSGDLADDDEDGFVNFTDNSSVLIHDGVIDGCTITSAMQGIRAEHLTMTNCRLTSLRTAIRVHSNRDDDAINVSSCIFERNRNGISG